jgi:hypothetical protein
MYEHYLCDLEVNEIAGVSTKEFHFNVILENLAVRPGMSTKEFHFNVIQRPFLV